MPISPILLALTSQPNLVRLYTSDKVAAMEHLGHKDLVIISYLIVFF